MVVYRIPKGSVDPWSGYNRTYLIGHIAAGKSSLVTACGEVLGFDSLPVSDVSSLEPYIVTLGLFKDRYLQARRGVDLLEYSSKLSLEHDVYRIDGTVHPDYLTLLTHIPPETRHPYPFVSNRVIGFGGHKITESYSDALSVGFVISLALAERIKNLRNGGSRWSEIFETQFEGEMIERILESFWMHSIIALELLDDSLPILGIATSADSVRGLDLRRPVSEAIGILHDSMRQLYPDINPQILSCVTQFPYIRVDNNTYRGVMFAIKMLVDTANLRFGIEQPEEGRLVHFSQPWEVFDNIPFRYRKEVEDVNKACKTHGIPLGALDMTSIERRTREANEIPSERPLEYIEIVRSFRSDYKTVIHL